MSNRMHNVYDERARRPHEAPVLARVRRSAGVHRPWHRGRDAKPRRPHWLLAGRKTEHKVYDH
jgi:hypothetical protein